jgi:hypothetical protein
MRIKSAPSASQPYPRYAPCASVKDYGARGDRTVDDAPAIQRAVDSVAAGCTIFFPPGTYSLRTTVTIKKDLIFQLAPQTTLVFESRSVSIIPDVTGSRSLTIQGEGPGTSIIKSSGFPTGGFDPFGPDTALRFKELRLRNIEISHTTSGYTTNITAPTSVYEIDSCLLASAYYVSLHNNAESISSSASIVNTEIRPHASWTVRSPSVLIRGLRVTGSGSWRSSITFRRVPSDAWPVSNVTVQDVTFDSVDAAGSESSYGLQFAISAGASPGTIRALIQSVNNFRGTRLLNASPNAGLLEVTLVSATFRRASANYSPIVLSDNAGGAQVHFRMIGCSLTHDGAQNAFDAVSKSLAASSSFVEVGNYQRGWSGI